MKVKPVKVRSSYNHSIGSMKHKCTIFGTEWYPQRRNVTTSMVGLGNGHIHKNLTKNGEPQRSSWGMQKKKKKKVQNGRVPIK